MWFFGQIHKKAPNTQGKHPSIPARSVVVSFKSKRDGFYTVSTRHGLFSRSWVRAVGSFELGVFNQNFCRFTTTKKKGLERNGMRSWDFILPVIYGVSCHGNLGNFLRPYLFPPVGHGFPQKVVVLGESGPQNGERNIQVKDLYCPESKGTTVDGSEIPNNHLGWWQNPLNNGINYQPQLISRISEP